MKKSTLELQAEPNVFGLPREIVGSDGLVDMSKLVDVIETQNKIKHDELGRRVGIAGVSIGRVANQKQWVMKPQNVAALADLGGLPPVPLLISNVIKSLPKKDQRAVVKALQGANRIAEAMGILQAVPVMSDVDIPPAELKRKRTAAEMLDIAMHYSVLKELGQISGAIGGSLGHTRLYQHYGDRMVAEAGSGKVSIPDGAIVMVEAVEESEIKNGDIVLVEFLSVTAEQRRYKAELYVYQGFRENGRIAYEHYLSYNSRYPIRMRDIGAYGQRKIGDTRRILGRATRIFSIPLK